MNAFDSPQVFFIYLTITSLVSIGFRWIALKRIESISIDITLFATLYCFTNLALDKSHHEVWIFKAIVDFILLLFLVIIHSNSYEKLHEKIREDIDSLKNHINPEDSSKLESLKRTVELAVELAYSKKKRGKEKRRKQIRKSIRDLGFDSEKILNDKLDETFFLPSPDYKYYLFAFGIITSTVIIIAMLPYRWVDYLLKLFFTY